LYLNLNCERNVSSFLATQEVGCCVLLVYIYDLRKISYSGFFLKQERKELAFRKEQLT